MGVNVTAPGKKNPLRQSTGLAAGARPVYKCTHVRVVFCFEVLIFLSFIDHLLAKARQQAILPRRCGLSLLFLSVLCIFFEFLVIFTRIRFSIVAPSLISSVLSILPPNCNVITLFSSGRSPSLHFRYRSSTFHSLYLSKLLRINISDHIFPWGRKNGQHSDNVYPPSPSQPIFADADAHPDARTGAPSFDAQ